MKLFTRHILFVVAALAIVSATSAQTKRDYTALVDPFIGTGGHGHTYPGPVMPFGMVQLSPDTRLDGWDGCSGYFYTDTLVYGFSHTHLSGTGIFDYCDVLFMPTTGTPNFNKFTNASGFQKKNEYSTPGYYKTFLDKYKIGVELTATTRVGVHRYTYPSTGEANIVIDLQHRDEVVDSWIEVVSNHEIRGYRCSSSWADNQRVYFYAKFSKPFKSYAISSGDVIQTDKSKVQGKNIKLVLNFDNPGEVISKVGISDVSTDGALKNLDTEVPDFDFKKVQVAAKAAWNKELSKIDVQGGEPALTSKADTNLSAHKKQTIFYTALYHCMLAPNIYNDVDGKYRGFDQKIHVAKGFNYYTVFSLWDTYRAEDPLFNLIDRARTQDFIKSFLAMYEQGGLLPIWPLASSETFCMVGNHSIPVIVDAYAKGIRGFDAEEALKAMKSAVNRDQFGLDSYRRNGAVLADDEQESVSKTLEYCIDDWCIAQMAKMMGHGDDYTEFIQRAQYWKNVYNNQNGFMQARVNGGWLTPFDPTEVDHNYTEGNAWQYDFLAPQDVETLVSKEGGKQKFEDRLDQLFTIPFDNHGLNLPDVAGLIGQYAHGNEPSHHMAYLYNFTDAPNKTQFYIHKIINDEYSANPNGLAGNEDCGQMSAWYVISSLGIYNIMPGQQQFQIGMPQFDRTVINLENGKQFTILNHGASVSRSNIYLEGMKLNNTAYNKIYIDYNTIYNGGQLVVNSGKTVNKLYEKGLEKPYSLIKDDLIVPDPYINAPAQTFTQPFYASMGCADADAKIYFTVDGSTPDDNSAAYTAPLLISSNTTVKAIAIKNGKKSFVDVATFQKLRNDIDLTLVNKYLPDYPAKGDNSLIDGLRGKLNWQLGNWQAFQGNDLVAILDMRSVKPVNTVSLGTIQDTGAWIIFPQYVQYYTSNDGSNYTLAATVNTQVDIKDTKVQIQEFTAKLNTSARYIKVVAKQYGPLPDWHANKGEQSYIFADEITVE